LTLTLDAHLDADATVGLVGVAAAVLTLILAPA
jgi:hypothetical protein